GCKAVIEKSKIQIPPIFNLLAREGNIPERDMFNTYNMGVGMTAVVAGDRADEAVRLLQAHGERAYILGEIADGETSVELW
ncbi:MAG: AIR synthase-related protein, partial [Angelakisella sp.]